MTIEIKLPFEAINKDLKPDESQGTVTEIKVQIGDTVVEGETYMTIEKNKTDIELPMVTSGIVKSIHVAEGDEVFENTVLMTLEVAEKVVEIDPTNVVVPQEAPPQYFEEKQPKITEKTTAVSPNEPKGKVITPLAKKLVKELNVNRLLLMETTTENRISRQIVKDFVKNQLIAPPQYEAAKRRALPDFTKFGNIERQKMSSIQFKTADNMSYAWTTVPHAWIMEKADLTALETMRQRYKKQVSEAGGALTLTAILTKVVAVALRQMPLFNASVDVENKEIVFKNYIHIGVAVDTKRGLLVPVIQDADRKSLTEIAVELTAFATKLRENDAKEVPMEGGTFTISNVGGIGGTGILPIVNTPQAAILGIAATQLEPQPTTENEGIVWRPMLPMTLGFDHRLINGADATRFLKLLRGVIEDPMRLIV